MAAVAPTILLAVSGALVLATGARGEWDDRARPFSLDHVALGPAPVAPATTVAAPTLIDPDLMPEREALATVAYFNQLWGEDRLAALPEIRSMYAPEVDFYGSVASVEEVMADKLRLAARWPERDYRLDPEASTATCPSLTSCIVEGEVTWRSSTPDGSRRSAGRARVLMGLERIGGRFWITREEGEVIERE